MNKLPEKLTLLRKHKNLSQGDLAKKINVPVTEYMQWENGNKICTIQQLKMLADIFGVTLDDLADNTKEVVIEEDILDESVMIPFNMGQDINATQVVDSSLESTVQTAQLDTVDDGHTRVVNSAELAEAQEIDEEEEYEEEPEEKPKKKAVKKTDPKKKKKQSIIIIVSVCAIVVVIALILLLLKGSSSSLSVGNDNRIAVGSTYSLYVDNKGTIKTYGDFSSTESFSSAVQVSAFDSHAAILKSNGTVVSSDGNSEVSEWSDIKYIAAGANHTVGVTNEGKVVCAGSEDACKVSDWSNISTVYAGNEFTIALTNDGEVKTSGNNTSAVSNQSNVAHVGISDNLIVLTKKDGTVSVYPIGSAESLDTSSWTNIQSTAVGTNLIAGLCKDGTVKLAYDDEEMVTKVASWKNIKYISANGSTLVGINASGNMVGAGDNSYNQYVDTSDSEETEDTGGELDEPKNIQISTTTANVVIKWDTVENADYYEVSIDTDPVTETKTSSNSTSVAASSLEDGQEYVVTVTAKSNDEDKYKESSATQTFTYTPKTVQLSTPSDVTSKVTASGWVIQWSEVENADHYVVNINNSGEFEVDTNTYTDTGFSTPGTYPITIKAVSDDEKYSESEVYSGTVNYALSSVNVTLTYHIGSETTYQSVSLYVGRSYSASELDEAAGNYGTSRGTIASTSPSAPVTIDESTKTIDIYVNATASSSSDATTQSEGE